MHQWNNMQYVSSAAFLLAVYSDYLSAANAELNCPNGIVQPQELLNFSGSQVQESLHIPKLSETSSRGPFTSFNDRLSLIS